VRVRVEIRSIDQQQLEARARTLAVPARSRTGRPGAPRKPAPVVSLQQLAAQQQQQQQQQ
jgi:hypothetical protein